MLVPFDEANRQLIAAVRPHGVGAARLGGRVALIERGAGDLIAEPTFALTHGHTLTDLSRTIHPYPTQSESLRIACDVYRRSRLTPRVRTWLERYFRWTR